MRLQVAGRLQKQHQHGMHRVEILAHRGLDRIDRGGKIPRSNQALAQAVNSIGQRVVGAGDVDEFLQFALESQVAVAQDLDLAFNQADGGRLVAQVRQPQRREQSAVAFEEVRVSAQIVGYFRVAQDFLFKSARVARRHISMLRNS